MNLQGNSVNRVVKKKNESRVTLINDLIKPRKINGRKKV